MPSGETRDINEINKFFRADDGLTVPEIEAQVTEAKFKNDWENKFAGKTINRAKGQDGVKQVLRQLLNNQPNLCSLSNKNKPTSVGF